MSRNPATLKVHEGSLPQAGVADTATANPDATLAPARLTSTHGDILMKSLTGLDATFLYLETPEMPMHVGSFNLCELPAGFKGSF